MECVRYPIPDVSTPRIPCRAVTPPRPIRRPSAHGRRLLFSARHGFGKVADLRTDAACHAEGVRARQDLLISSSFS